MTLLCRQASKQTIVYECMPSFNGMRMRNSEKEWAVWKTKRSRVYFPHIKTGVALTLQPKPHTFSRIFRTHPCMLKTEKTNKFVPIINFPCCRRVLAFSNWCCRLFFRFTSYFITILGCFLDDIFHRNQANIFVLSEIICRSVLHMWHDLDTIMHTHCAQIPVCVHKGHTQKHTHTYTRSHELIFLDFCSTLLNSPIVAHRCQPFNPTFIYWIIFDTILLSHSFFVSISKQ